MACKALLRIFRGRRREENENLGLNGEVSNSDEDEAGDKLRVGDSADGYGE